MANKIVGVQPLHHDDDGAFALVVKPQKQGIAKPFVADGNERSANGRPEV